MHQDDPVLLFARSQLRQVSFAACFDRIREDRKTLPITTTDVPAHGPDELCQSRILPRPNRHILIPGSIGWTKKVDSVLDQLVKPDLQLAYLVQHIALVLSLEINVVFGVVGDSMAEVDELLEDADRILLEGTSNRAISFSWWRTVLQPASIDKKRGLDSLVIQKLRDRQGVFVRPVVIGKGNRLWR